ncbi:MAG: EAL domain-containing protein [Bacillaceae bacterium]|nr:EAL domain-containing protein [Bacillaceae bacterium]
MFRLKFSGIGLQRFDIIWKYIKEQRKSKMNQYKQFAELQRIIRSRSMQTFFQPIVNLENGQIQGYEALNRPPMSRFFSNTEAFYEFVGQMDQVFMVERYLRRLSLERYSEQLSLHPNMKDALLFLNVHPQVLADPNYKNGETLSILREKGISPEQIVLELTEKQAVTDFVEFEKVLSNYRKQGFRIAIDDAGSGYNSLKSLVYLKPEFIKLDRTLIQNIHRDFPKQQMVQLLLEYANRSKTYVIAEGIEKQEEMFILRKYGVHLGQGYYIGKPALELMTIGVPGDFCSWQLSLDV